MTLGVFVDSTWAVHGGHSNGPGIPAPSTDNTCAMLVRALLDPGSALAQVLRWGTDSYTMF